MACATSDLPKKAWCDVDRTTPLERIAIADPIQKQKRCAMPSPTLPFAFLVPDTARVCDLEVLVKRITTLLDQQKPRGIRAP